MRSRSKSVRSLSMKNARNMRKARESLSQIQSLNLDWMRTAGWYSETKCSHRTAPDSGQLEGYEQGKPQPSFDKQFVRDWLKANPDSDYLLPEEIVDKTVDKYKEAFELLTGRKFD